MRAWHAFQGWNDFLSREGIVLASSVQVFSFSKGSILCVNESHQKCGEENISSHKSQNPITGRRCCPWCWNWHAKLCVYCIFSLYFIYLQKCFHIDTQIITWHNSQLQFLGALIDQMPIYLMSITEILSQRSYTTEDLDVLEITEVHLIKTCCTRLLSATSGFIVIFGIIFISE